MEKEFHFNDCGVCMNPNVTSYVASKTKCMLETCYTERGWSGAWFIQGNTWGVASPCTAQDYDKFFPTEAECIAYVAGKALDIISSHLKEKDMGFFNKELKALMNYRPKPIQLSLFDF